MTEKKVYFWNDETMSLSYKGTDYANGDPIPEKYREEQPEKFKHFKDVSLQISSKKKVKFEEKKNQELETLKNAFNALSIEKAELIKNQTKLAEKVKNYEASIEEIEVLESIKEKLAESKALVGELTKYKLNAEKKIGDFESFIETLAPILGQDSISKDDKSALLGLLENLKGGE